MTLDPITLSVLRSALAGIAEEMGTVLVRSAYSSNIKERRDCSAALFDASGRMVAQAEHIPVHLGAMPESVAAVIARDPQPGDVWILNDPYTGGTHLPDITLVSPVDSGGEIVGFGVTRAHHSDVGGMSPGSMPCIGPARPFWRRCRSVAGCCTQFLRCGCTAARLLVSRCMQCSSVWARLRIALCTYDNEYPIC